MVVSVSHLPLAISTIIINTTPFWVAILGYYLNKEALTRFELGCMAGCFTGVVVLATAKKSEKVDGTTGNHYVGFFAALVCSWFFGCVIVITRKLRQYHFSVMLYHYTSIAQLVYISYAAYLFATGPSDPDRPYPSIFYLTSKQGKWLLLLSCINIVSQVFQTFAFQKGKSATMTLIGYISVFYGFILDVTVFDISFNSIQLGGALTVLCFNLMVIWQKIVNERKKDEEEQDS